MDKILADTLPLDNILLSTDEDQYDKQASSLVTKLQDPITQQSFQRDNLDFLDPTAHTIPYLFVLNACIDYASASGKAAPRQLPVAVLPEGALWPYLTQILLKFDPIQVRYVGEFLTKVVSVVGQGAEQTQNTVPAIQLLQHVILRLDSSSSTFTSTHYIFVRLCLLSQAYSEALSILDRPIYHIPTNPDRLVDSRLIKHLCSTQDAHTYLTVATGLTRPVASKTYLEYYLMGAMCYMALGMYVKALVFLEIVLVAPTQQNVASAVMVEAYKKWVLCSLLVNGTPPDLPRSTFQSTMRHIRAIAKPYDCIADAFKGHNPKRLRAEIEEGMEVWQQDDNYGLILEVYEAHQKFSISRLGRTYASIPVSEVIRRTTSEAQGGADTLAYLQSLIQNGQLNAILTPSKDGNDQILRFLPDPQSRRSEAQVEQDLALRTQEVQVLLKHISDIDHKTEISREFIEFLRKLKRIRDEEKKSGRPHAANSMLMDELDEDMMAEF